MPADVFGRDHTFYDQGAGLIAGGPWLLAEPVVENGPLAMNSQAEVQQAFDRLACPKWITFTPTFSE